MKPLVSIIMGSTSDLPVMEKTAKFFDEMEIPFEINALSAHRTPEAVEQFAKNARMRGIKVIIAAAGMAAHLPGVIASMTTLPVIGVPIKASLDGMDALLAIVQMPPGIPVATVGINGSLNAAILALQMIASTNSVVIVGLHKDNSTAYKPYKISSESKKLISKISKRNYLILNVFGSPYALQDIDINDISAVLVSYENNQYSMKVTAEAYLGKHKIQGRLPVVVNQQLKFGMGVDTSIE